MAASGRLFLALKENTMRKIFTLFIIACGFSLATSAQSADEKAIRGIMDQQILFWNKGDIDHFMGGYWENDSLMFVGRNGVTYGYANTMANYHKNYPDKDHMGILSFDILHVNRLSPEYYFVVGKFHLQRTVGDASGHFTLVFRKIKGQWKIISDHSS
jgi:ketosteroid isomerase-like protein